MALNNMETFLWQGQKLKIVLTTYLAVNLIVYKDFYGFHYTTFILLHQWYHVLENLHVKWLVQNL